MSNWTTCLLLAGLLKNVLSQFSESTWGSPNPSAMFPGPGQQWQQGNMPQVGMPQFSREAELQSRVQELEQQLAQAQSREIGANPITSRIVNNGLGLNSRFGSGFVPEQLVPPSDIQSSPFDSFGAPNNVQFEMPPGIRQQERSFTRPFPPEIRGDRPRGGQVREVMSGGGFGGGIDPNTITNLGPVDTPDRIPLDPTFVGPSILPKNEIITGKDFGPVDPSKVLRVDPPFKGPSSRPKHEIISVKDAKRQAEREAIRRNKLHKKKMKKDKHLRKQLKKQRKKQLKGFKKSTFIEINEPKSRPRHPPPPPRRKRPHRPLVKLGLGLLMGSLMFG